MSIVDSSTTTLAAPLAPPLSENVRFCPTPLSPRQHAAIALLCAGRNLSQTAHSLGLSPRTLHRWRTQDPHFIASLHRRQRDLHDTAASRLRLLLLSAIKLATQRLDTGQWSDRYDAALTLLKTLDASSLLSPPTTFTPDQALDELIQSERSSQNLAPATPITEEDRAAYLSLLELDPSDLSPNPSPTHLRLAGAPAIPPSPYPAP